MTLAKAAKAVLLISTDIFPYIQCSFNQLYVWG